MKSLLLNIAHSALFSLSMQQVSFPKGRLHSSSDGDRAMRIVCRKLGSGLNTVWVRGVNGAASTHSVSEFGYLFLCLCFWMPLLGLTRSPPGLSVSAPCELPCFPGYFPSSPGMNRQSPVVNP